MKVRVLVAAVLVAALAVVAVGATGASGSSSASTLTVWLQTDAQNGWPDLVASTNSQFKKDHPGVDVNVQYQQWTTHLQKFDATLAGGNAPDVIEMGNTEMTKYMAAGAFQDLTSTGGRSTTRPSGSRAWSSGGPTAGSCTAFRTTRARASSRTAPTCSRRPGSRPPDEPRAVHSRCEEARGDGTDEGLLAGLHRRAGLVHRDELRVRLRRTDRRDASAASGSGRSTRRGPSPA